MPVDPEVTQALTKPVDPGAVNAKVLALTISQCILTAQLWSKDAATKEQYENLIKELAQHLESWKIRILREAGVAVLPRPD